MLLDAGYLNENCHCQALDKARLEFPNYFSAYPHFVSHSVLAQISNFISDYETVVQSEKFADFLAHSKPSVDWHAPERGVFNSYDFHMGLQGPQLIEINTNAAGAVLGLYASKTMVNCCEYLPQGTHPTPHRFDAGALVQMFHDEYALRFPGRAPQRIAIVDANPEQQFFYPEFQLVARLLAEQGIEAIITDARNLEIGERPHVQGKSVDFIYNRLTDFYFENPEYSVLRKIYHAGLATVSPNPTVHARMAHKANFATLWSTEFDSLPQAAHIRHFLPETVMVSTANEQKLWNSRRDWFFKPVSGYGSKAVYRGDKLTRRAWSEIQAGSYIAQRYVKPDTRRLKADLALKYDLRVYTYSGKILGMLARYYQGQTTNMRTEHGGLATVLLAA